MNSAVEELWDLPGFEPAEIPANDSERVAALRGLGLLDSPPSEAFDQVTRLTAKALQVPVVLVSLVDENRQWFKSRVGVDFTQTTRTVSFCAHVMVSLRPLVVRDATLDVRFAANPLVMNAPFVRAYAGIPLFTGDGHAIGTLCAIDQKPREFEEAELKTLRDAASIVQGFIYAQELGARTETVVNEARERERLFRDTFEQAAIGIIHSSPAGDLLRVNQRVCDMLGYSALEMHTLSFLDISHPDDIDATSELLQNISSGLIDNCSIEKRYLKHDGGYLWTYLSVALKRSRLGKPDYFIAMLEDITERKKFEAELVRSRDLLSQRVVQQTQKLQETHAALRVHVKKLLDSERRVQQTEQRLHDMADCIPMFLGYWNRQLVCEFANAAYREFFGVAAEHIVGMTMLELLGPEGFADVEMYARRALEGRPQLFERTRKRADGFLACLEIRYSPVLNETGKADGFFILATDVTTARNVQLALEGANARLTNSSVTDPLTGIANRVHFVKCGEEAGMACSDKAEPYGVIILDLDGLKHVNEKLGHEAGDGVLHGVGALLKNQLRNHRDVAARLVGGEFAILCFGDLDEDLLGMVGEEIRRRVAEERFPGDVRMTASFGAAICSAGAGGFKAVYGRAERALREAKTGGGNRVVMGR